MKKPYFCTFFLPFSDSLSLMTFLKANKVHWVKKKAFGGNNKNIQPLNKKDF